MTLTGLQDTGRQKVYLRLIYGVLALAALSVYLIPFLPAGQAGNAYVAIHVVMSLAMLAVWYHSCQSVPRESEPHQNIQWNLKSLLVFALILRLIFLPAPMISSNDGVRYLWDGAVAVSGLDPYIISPDMPAAQILRESWPTPEEHSAYPTLYPPGALVMFALSALAGPIKGMWVWKGLVTLAGLACVYVGYDLLERKGLLRHFPLLALSPLLIMEAGIGAHVDIFSALAVLLALNLCVREKYVLAGCILGWSASVKFLPAALVGPLIFYLRPKAAFQLLSASIFVVVSIYAAAVLLGYKPIGILPVFFEKWRNGAPFYTLLASFLSPAVLPYVLGGLAVSAFGLAAYLAYRKHIYVAMLLTLSTPLLLSPVVFPWYLCALVPLLALRPNAAILAWVSFAPFGYVVLNRWISEGVWAPAVWPLWVIGGGIVLGLGFDLLRKPARAD